MSNEHDRRPDRNLDELDALFRVANRVQSRKSDDDELFLAYLGGTASGEETERLKALIRRSPEARARFVEILQVREQAEEEFSTDAAREIFDRAAVPPMPEKPSARRGSGLLARMRGTLGHVVLQPAFAYGVMVLVAAYPTYQWLSQIGVFPATDKTLSPSHLTTVRLENDNDVRGAADRSMPALISLSTEAQGFVVVLRLDDLPDEDPGATTDGRYIVRIAAADREVLRLVRTREDFLSGSYLVLGVNSEGLQEGQRYNLTVDFAQPGHYLDGVQLHKRTFVVQVSKSDD